MKKIKEFFKNSKNQAIVFIIAVVFLCAYGYSKQKPYMSIIVKLEDPSPITRDFLDKHINAFYRGYKVGKVTKIRLAEDQMSVLVYVDIYYKNLRLPKNTDIEIGTENILGQKFINFVYPEHPVTDLVGNGEILDGHSAKFFKDINNFMKDEFESHKIQKMFTNFESITANMDEIIKENKSEIKPIIKELNSTSANLNLVIKDVRDVSSDKQVKDNLKSSINNTAKTLEVINNIIENPKTKSKLEKTPEKINNALNNLDKTTQNLEQTNTLLNKTNESMSCLNEKIPKDSLKNVDCMSIGLSKMMSQKFVIFKMMFGQPGKSLERCDKPASCSK